MNNNKSPHLRRIQQYPPDGSKWQLTAELTTLMITIIDDYLFTPCHHYTSAVYVLSCQLFQFFEFNICLFDFEFHNVFLFVYTFVWL